MPVNNMNTGVDYQFYYYDGNSGSIVRFGDVQDIKITAQKHDIKSMPYNDDPRFGFVPDGFRIDFTIIRTGPELENLAVNLANNFSQGKAIRPGYLNQTVQNADGTVSRYQYTNFMTFLTDHGDISREKVVTLKFEGMASRKVQIA